MKRFFEISKLNKDVPRKGSLLISEPFLADNFFKRSVVYLCEHNEDGSFGFVLNNMLTVNLGDVMDGFTEECGFQIGFGGPVNSSNLYYLHALKSELPDSVMVTNGVYTGGDFDIIQKLINTNLIDEKQIRFFLGYSGWGAGQLESELEDNSWVVCNDYDVDIISKSDKSLWKNVLENMGGNFKVISNFPEDPALN